MVNGVALKQNKKDLKQKMPKRKDKIQRKCKIIKRQLKEE